MQDPVDSLEDIGSGVEPVIGALSESLQDTIRDAVSNATTFVSGLDWLQGDQMNDDELAVGRPLLVDRSTILVSSIVPGSKEEQAGFGNGLVVLSRRLMAQELISDRDPA